jgi:DNA-nicking Smr family endonuclease
VEPRSRARRRVDSTGGRLSQASSTMASNQKFGASRPPNSERSGGEDFASLVGEVRRFEPVARVKRSPPRPRAPRRSSARQRFLYPAPLEPRLARARACSERNLQKLIRGEPAPAHRIDLHGFDRERARRQLQRFIESVASRGPACVLVIHGRGRGSGEAGSVLKQSLPGWLTAGPQAKNVLAFAPAAQRDGGEGATYVLLDKARKRT